MKKVMILACFMVAGAALSGCSTVEGMGKDLKKAGQAIQDAS